MLFSYCDGRATLHAVQRHVFAAGRSTSLLSYPDIVTLIALIYRLCYNVKLHTDSPV